MDNFTGFNLPPSLSASLERMGYQTPTPIQQKAIPPALEGRDILGSAQTGTGKTAAFGIPLAAHLLMRPQSRALVMTPTRELAVQVIGILRQLASLPENDRSESFERGAGRRGGRSGEYGRRRRGERPIRQEEPEQADPSVLRTALLIGGESMTAQLRQLRWHPRIIVGTPGRINDHLARGTLEAGDFDLCVLDETDRMLDMGFMPQLDKIIQHLAPVRQTLTFSATFPRNIMQLAAKYLKDPVRIEVGDQNAVVKTVKQENLQVPSARKYGILLEELTKREGSVLVFVKTKYGADKLADQLVKDQHEAAAIHGDLRQRERASVIRAFREQRYRILVATDIAARGLDIPHIEHVINYDLPQAPEDYIHRIGRTGRAGAAGSSLCLISPEDKIKWRAIERLLNPQEKNAPYGRDAGFGKRREQRAAPRRRTAAPPGSGVFIGRRERFESRERFEPRERFEFEEGAFKAGRDAFREKPSGRGAERDRDFSRENGKERSRDRDFKRESYKEREGNRGREGNKSRKDSPERSAARGGSGRKFTDRFADKRSFEGRHTEEKPFREGPSKEGSFREGRGSKREAPAFRERKSANPRASGAGRKPSSGGRKNTAVSGRR